jgi:hypothetical protein
VKALFRINYFIGARLSRVPIVGHLPSRLFRTQWDKQIELQNLTKRWRWPDASTDIVYSSHTIEHLWKEDGRHFAKEAFRVLKPNSILRIVVPDGPASP